MPDVSLDILAFHLLKHFILFFYIVYIQKPPFPLQSSSEVYKETTISCPVTRRKLKYIKRQEYGTSTVRTEVYKAT